MSDELLEEVERQVASLPMAGLPGELRGRVLTDVQRELRAARWDRRLARVAAVMLILGIGLNVGSMSHFDSVGDGRWARGRQPTVRTSLVDTAVIVAEATDAATAQRVAHQLATMTGRKLSEDESAAIETAVRRSGVRAITVNKG